MGHKVKKKNFEEVLEAIKKNFRDESKDGKEFWVESLNMMLDDMASEDFFGTEGQNDPRGDQRD